MAITVLGKTFESKEERREYFREELRKKLPELKKMDGFPIGEDEDIIELSDPPYYTACPNPWLNDFISDWEKAKDHKKNSLKKVQVPYPKDIIEGKSHSIYNAHSYHTKVPHYITSKCIFYYTRPGDIVIDTFAGTGMTGVGGMNCQNIKREKKIEFENDFKSIGERLEIGKRHVINIDLSSIATHISHGYNSDLNLEKFQEEYKKLLNKLNRFENLYKYKGENTKEGKIQYVAYAAVYNCSNCSKQSNYYDLAYDENDNYRKKTICPNCGVEDSKKELDPVFQTKIDEVTGESITQVFYEPVVVNFKVGTTRYAERVDRDDLSHFNLDFQHKDLIPVVRMREGTESRRNDKYGLTHVHHFYTEKTLFFISEYLNEIKKFSQKKHFYFLLTAILPKLTKLNRFMPQHGSRALVGPMSNTLYLPPFFVENDFLKQLNFQFKKVKKGLSKTGYQVTSLQSATNLNNIKDNSIDYAFIDPPFGANIMYSELNNLSEAWLRVLTDNDAEAVESKGQNKGKIEYENLMTKSFKELFRVLKPEAWVTVEFSNTSAAIWNIIQYCLNKAGFIVAKVDALNKKRGGLHAMIGPTAVKQDLVISCYKPSNSLEIKIKDSNSSRASVWEFIEDYLNHLPVHIEENNSTTAIIERSPKILYDRLIAFYVQNNLSVPINASKFQVGLRERFIERDGMFFTNEQVQEYDRKKAEVPKFTQLSILIASEQDGIVWLQNYLKDSAKNYQDIQPEWMKALAGERKGDIIPELKTILEENFLQNDAGEWYVPDPDKEEDLEKLRNRRLLKQFEEYREQAFKPKGKIKECRVEALRAGFKQCYQDKDFETIVRVGDRIPENLLMEDEVLLQFYDIAAAKV